MRKDFSVRLRLSAAEGEHIKQVALREGRSQTSVLTRLVQNGMRYERGEQSATGQVLGKLAHLIRTGEAQ
jgi:hypothetical protein